MDINALQAFIAVAETRSFSIAALQLHLSQPAVSKRISGLEQQLDARLFDRIGKTTHLTESGTILLPKAKSIINQVDESRRLLQNLSGRISGKLRLGTSHHIGLHRLPPILSRFHKDHPSVALDIDFTDSELACEAVLRGDIELAIVTLPEKHDHLLVHKSVWEDPLVFVCNHSHPLANASKGISLKTLSETEALLPSSSTATRKIVDEIFYTRGLTQHVGMETNYLETLKMMTTIGLGWSALPEVMVDEGLCQLDIEGVSIKRRLGVVTHKERTLSNAGEAFLDLVSRSNALEH